MTVIRPVNYLEIKIKDLSDEQMEKICYHHKEIYDSCPLEQKKGKCPLYNLYTKRCMYEYKRQYDFIMNHIVKIDDYILK